MVRPLVLLPVAAAVAGVVLVFTAGSLLGAALIIGGTGALGVVMLPAIVDRIAALLGGARLRRW